MKLFIAVMLVALTAAPLCEAGWKWPKIPKIPNPIDLWNDLKNAYDDAKDFLSKTYNIGSGELFLIHIF